MTNDRNYYRCLETSELQEIVRYALPGIDWQELAIALAERLDTIRREVYDEFED